MLPTAPPVELATALPVPLDQNPAAVYLASLGAGSQRTMRTALNTIAALLGAGEVLDAEGHDVRCLTVAWADLRYQHTAAIRATLIERYAPVTSNKLIAALRRVLKEARRLGQISVDEYDRAADIKSIRAERLPRGRALSDGEIAALMRACADDVSAAGARDAAILALLRRTGVRRSEAAALDLDDYDRETGALTIRNSKGNKDRLTYVMPAQTSRRCSAWLATKTLRPPRATIGGVRLPSSARLLWYMSHIFHENDGFQQTRGLIRLMRIIAARLWTTGLADKRCLIAAQDLDFNDHETLREISQINSTLGNAIAHDIASHGTSVAEVMDANIGGNDAQDAARLLLMASLANVPNAVIGLSIPEVGAYLCAPGRDLTRLKGEVLEKLSTAAWYLHGSTDGKLFFKNVQNLNAKLEDRVKAYAPDQAVRELRSRLEDMFRPTSKWCYQRVLALPALDEIELLEDQVTLLWSEIKQRAATNPKWQWHRLDALDNLKKDSIGRDVWREEGGYVDKGPFPQPKTTVLVKEESRNPETGKVTLRITPVNGEMIYYEYDGTATTASAKLDTQPLETDKLRVSFLVVDPKGFHETGAPYSWKGRITLRYRPPYQHGNDKCLELYSRTKWLRHVTGFGGYNLVETGYNEHTPAAPG